MLLSDTDTPEQRKKILQDELGIEMTEEFDRSETIDVVDSIDRTSVSKDQTA